MPSPRPGFVRSHQLPPITFILVGFPVARVYLIRDNDGIYGDGFRRHVESLGIEEIRIAPRSPWQSPFVERLIGSIRRECLDHVLIWNEAHLKRILTSYFDYYHRSRTHRARRQYSISSAVEPPERGKVVAVAQVGGLHHRYGRAA